MKKNILNFFQILLSSWKLHPILFILSLFFQIVQGFEPLATAWIMKLIFDRIEDYIRYNKMLDIWDNPFFELLILQLLISIVYRLANLAGEFINSEYSRKANLQSQIEIYTKLNSLKGLKYFENTDFFRTINFATHGVNFGLTQVPQIILNMVRQTISLISFLSVLLLINPVLAIAVFITSIPQFIFRERINNQRYRIANTNSLPSRIASYYGSVLCSPLYIKEIRMFSLGEYFLTKFKVKYNEIHDTQRKQQIKELKINSGLGIWAESFAIISFILIIFQSLRGSLGIGDIVFFTSALRSIQTAFHNILSSINNYSANRPYYDEYHTLLNLPQDLDSPNHFCQIQDLKIGITFEDVSFRYSPETSWILRNCHLFIPKGKIFGLVGINGVGKTTIIKLLLRFYDPTRGRILWDGVDIKEFDTDEFRKKIAPILQDFSRYDLSVKENIGIGNNIEIENIEKIRNVARVTKVDNFVKKLPREYDTILSLWLNPDNISIDLSGGQWQRIALARMLMRDAADVLILDEPTASLDTRSENDLYKLITNNVQEKTCILISHRLSTISMADIIAVLSGGQITEYGTHNELIKCKGEYYELYMLQAKKYIHGAKETI